MAHTQLHGAVPRDSDHLIGGHRALLVVEPQLIACELVEAIQQAAHVLLLRDELGELDVLASKLPEHPVQRALGLHLKRLDADALVLLDQTQCNLAGDQ